MTSLNNNDIIDRFWQDQLTQSYFEDLKSLIARKSIFAQDIGLMEVATFLELLFQKAGAQVILDTTYKAPFVLATFTSPKKDAKTLIFYNHYDTVPADADQEWQSDPFELTIRDNFIYGRGVDDDKGHIIARLTAVQKYLAEYGSLPINIIFMMEGAEESASVDLEHYLKKYQSQLQDSELLIWEQGIRNELNQLEVTGGNKGIVTFNAEIKSAKLDSHSKLGGSIESATWYLINALTSLRGNNGQILIDGLTDTIQAPSQKELELVAQYALEDEDKIKDLYGLQLPMLQSDRLEFLKTYYFQPALTIQGIWSGYLGQGVKTIIPSQAQAKLEIRLVPGMDPKVVFKQVQHQLQKNGFGHVELTYTLGEKGYRSDLSHPAIQHLIFVLDKHYPGGLSLLPTSAGTGPMHTVFEELAVPMASFGLGSKDSRDHAGDENISIADYYTHIILVEELIKSYE
ncbi:M20/M25/M40 family metallo-hydrolase [Streptococcus parauberis]|uniref:M20/M25/M40 family metallo-hydrolase n=1 Tax=Streptococcus parauberis TaxID=1348 RepID=UPI00288F540A|nr:M20/M25/M40 family metallo-hydrolase [Streptococcus parauberis]MDT2749532.1 M20/M25/M40 family metallo-hydrolase [Streptococcus parauberis]